MEKWLGVIFFVSNLSWMMGWFVMLTFWILICECSIWIQKFLEEVGSCHGVKQFIKPLIQFSSTDRTTYLACTPSTARMNSKLQRNQSSSNGERTLKDALRNLEVNATKEMLIHQHLSEKKLMNFSCLYKVLRITSAHHLHYIQIQE